MKSLREKKLTIKTKIRNDSIELEQCGYSRRRMKETGREEPTWPDYKLKVILTKNKSQNKHTKHKKKSITCQNI